MKYYKKSVPATPIYFANGMTVRFGTNDRITGYFATDNVWMQEQFSKIIQRSQGGLIEIAQTEYEEDYVKKKGVVFPKPLPIQEIRAANPPDTSTSHQSPAVVAEIRNTIAIPLVEEPHAPQESDAANSIPKIGKRRMRRRTLVPTTE